MINNSKSGRTHWLHVQLLLSISTLCTIEIHDILTYILTSVSSDM